MNARKPYRQGHLDHLCGLYAVVNAIRRTLGEPNEFGGMESRWLFQTLVKELERRRLLAEFMIEGLNQAHVRWSLQFARRALIREYVTTFAFRTPFHGQATTPRIRLLKAIRVHLRAPSRAVLVRLSEHWSVVAKVSPASLILFDSWRLERVPLEACAIGYEAALRRRDDPWAVQPSSLFLLEAAEAACATVGSEDDD